MTKLKLNGLVYTTENPVRIEELKELGAKELEDKENKKASSKKK